MMRNKGFALFADESTDMAHRSQLSVMARFSRPDHSVSTHFFWGGGGLWTLIKARLKQSWKL